VTIMGSARDVWPWLAQMGAGARAGWYSYDFFDNGCRPSVSHIVPELQSLRVGMVFPALPGATEAFTLLSYQPERFLVLGWRSPEGLPLATWAFVLEQRQQTTRLLVRARGAADYSFHGLPRWLSRYVIRLVHFMMQRKQLLEIAERVEVTRPRLTTERIRRSHSMRRTVREASRTECHPSEGRLHAFSKHP
jgi:hypothetical protein